MTLSRELGTEYMLELLSVVYAGVQYVDGGTAKHEQAAAEGCLTVKAQPFSLSSRPRRSKEALCAVQAVAVRTRTV